MAGSVIVVGTVAASALLAAGLALAGAGAVASQRVAGAADNAAVAAADALSGAVSGDPCDRAAQVAAAADARVDSCTADGAEVVIAVAATFAGFPITAAARAGPPR